jgi:3-hydroxyisobutyrate dehydrogenase
MGPQNALESTGYMLVSGNRELIKKLEPQLSALTGKLINFGEEAGKAAAMKLTGNLFLVAFTAGIADTLSFAHALNISVSELLQLFDTWNPGSSLPARLKRMTADNFSDASWRLDMARKDTGLFIREAANKNVHLKVIPAVAALMDEWIQKGHGKDDWSIIGKVDKE